MTGELLEGDAALDALRDGTAFKGGGRAFSAGWDAERPAVVSTSGDMDALPNRTIIMIPHPKGAIAAQAASPGTWYLISSPVALSSVDLLIYGSVTVLYTPPQPKERP